MSAFDAVDGARSAASKCYRLVASTPERFKEVRPGNDDGVWSFEGIGEDRRRNADKVDPGIGRTRMGQRIFECVLSIGTRSAHSIMASGFTAAQTGRTHDRTRPMLQLGQKVLAKAAPSTHDPKRTSPCLGRPIQLERLVRQRNFGDREGAVTRFRGDPARRAAR